MTSSKVWSSESRDRLKEDLRVLCEWSVTWQMKLNTDKCKVMHIGAQNLEAEYFMEGNKLEKVSEEKDLGVMISRNFEVSK